MTPPDRPDEFSLLPYYSPILVVVVTGNLVQPVVIRMHSALETT